ncbi:MAG TPA: hypothetical protein VNQ76_08510 [Planctomicrobium sp.]|nr:hypothetical protein [Planctomicrobium sp.]
MLTGTVPLTPTGLPIMHFDFSPKVLRHFLPALCIATFVLVGCGGGGASPKLGKVRGIVTLDQQPLANALVSFYPADGRPSMGMTDDQGVYELTFTEAQKGAIVGNHIVRITTAQTSGEGIDPAKAKEILPARYHEDSELTANVKAGDNSLNFDLKM